jgi:hypothetical protein
VVFTQTHLLNKEVFLVDKVDKKTREAMKHMKCICFVRPTPESLQAIAEELRRPLYGEYHLCAFNFPMI